MTRIIIADDHALLRNGLKAVLACETDILVVGEASNSAEVQSILSDVEADVLILDISMPGASGLSAIKQAQAIRPNIKVLIFSAHSEELFALRALRQGASGYVTKGSSYQDLIDAIRLVASGRKYIPESIAEQLAEAVKSDSEPPRHEQLTELEYEVFLKLATGKSVAATADELALSVASVSNYHRRILRKMEFSGNADLIKYAVAHKLVLL